MINNTYVVIAIIAIIINNITWFLLYKFKKPKVKSINKNEVTFKQVQEDLMNMIHYKCYIANQRVLQPLVDKAHKNTPLINDKIVNNVTVQITKEILNEISEDYKEKLLKIYNEENFEEVILDLVYNVVTEMSMSINKRSIKKLYRKSTFKSFTKNDIDS